MILRSESDATSDSLLVGCCCDSAAAGAAAESNEVQVVVAGVSGDVWWFRGFTLAAPFAPVGTDDVNLLELTTLAPAACVPPVVDDTIVAAVVDEGAVFVVGLAGTAVGGAYEKPPRLRFSFTAAAAAADFSAVVGIMAVCNSAPPLPDPLGDIDVLILILLDGLAVFSPPTPEGKLGRFTRLLSFAAALLTADRIDAAE